MKNKNTRKTTFGEAYTIRYEYQKEDGFWKTSEETQIVDVKHGVNEKNNHEKAGEMFMKQNKHLKNLNIKAIIYQ